jgi:hypothetical protein
MYTSGYETYTYFDPSMIASSATLGAMIGTYSVVLLAFYVLLVIAQWKIFTKAGEAGWKSLIPIYNLVIMYKIVGLSPWLLLIYLTAVIPVVGYIAILILSIVSMVKLGKAFGKGTGFIVGLIFLTPIFQMILGFGSSTYEGPDTTK